MKIIRPQYLLVLLQSVGKQNNIRRWYVYTVRFKAVYRAKQQTYKTLRALYMLNCVYITKGNKKLCRLL